MQARDIFISHDVPAVFSEVCSAYPEQTHHMHIPSDTSSVLVLRKTGL